MSNFTNTSSASSQAKTAAKSKFYFAEVGESDYETATWTWIEGMKSVSFPVPDKPEIDVTTTSSTVRKFISGKGSIPDWVTSLDFYPKNAVHMRLIREIAPSLKNRIWKIEHENFTVVFKAYVKSWNASGSMDSQFTGDFVLKISGSPTILFHDDFEVKTFITSDGKSYKTKDNLNFKTKG